MKESELKARAKRFQNELKKTDNRASFEKQRDRIKSDKYYDTRKRID